MNNVITVPINTTYPAAEKHGNVDINDVYDCARAGWGIDKSINVHDLKYVVAIYRGDVKGVFAVDENGWYNQVKSVNDYGNFMENPPIWRPDMSGKNNPRPRKPKSTDWNFRGMDITDEDIGKAIAKKWIENHQFSTLPCFWFFE